VIGRTATAGTAPATDMGAAPVPATPPLDGVEPAPGPATTPETATPAPDDNGTQ
jgi:hypothetical protein